MSVIQSEPSYQAAAESRFTTKELCICAAMSTIVFLATFVPKIPIPLGYAHMGDATIFLIVMLIPRRPAFLAACIGSTMADIIGGFYIWAMPTIVIKLIMAYIVYIIARPDQETPGLIKTAAAFAAASLWMTFGYAGFGAVLYDSVAAGIASGYGLLVKSLVNTAAALVLLKPLKKSINISI